jgi:ribosomal subunit interface protein
MNIELTSGKEVNVSEMLRERVESKLEKIEDRLGAQLFFRVRFEKVSADQYSCQINFSSSKSRFSASATEDDLIKSADQAIAKIDRQLKRVQSKKASRDRTSIRDTIDLNIDLGDELDV